MEIMTSRETVDLLNDLVRVNNDRIAGYMKAIEELRPEDVDLNILFIRNIDQSRRFKMVLGTELQALGGDMEIGASLPGAIYRAWMDVNASLTAHSRHAILGRCVFGEDAAQKAYEAALNSEHIPAHLVSTILEEKKLLEQVQDQLEALQASISTH
jgi:uncharacterized protein (TIGR02284 family)